ncbi:MAG: hypothetical protein WB565_11205 [Acidimicrobiales bacterium]
MDSILNFFQLKAFSRGLRGYHTAWIVVGVAIWMLKRARNQNDVVYRTKLKPGEQLLIRTATKRAGPDGS